MALMGELEVGGDALNSRTGVNRSILVTTTSQLVFPNQFRVLLFIKNDTNTDIWINFNDHAEPVPTKGFKIDKNGGYLELGKFKGAIYAVVASGTAYLTAMEL
jgi:hypothetical protein